MIYLYSFSKCPWEISKYSLRRFTEDEDFHALNGHLLNYYYILFKLSLTTEPCFTLFFRWTSSSRLTQFLLWKSERNLYFSLTTTCQTFMLADRNFLGGNSLYESKSTWYDMTKSLSPDRPPNRTGPEPSARQSWTSLCISRHVLSTPRFKCCLACVVLFF